MMDQQKIRVIEVLGYPLFSRSQAYFNSIMDLLNESSTAQVSTDSLESAIREVDAATFKDIKNSRRVLAGICGLVMTLVGLINAWFIYPVSWSLSLTMVLVSLTLLVMSVLLMQAIIQAAFFNWLMMIYKIHSKVTQYIFISKAAETDSEKLGCLKLFSDYEDSAMSYISDILYTEAFNEDDIVEDENDS